MLNNAERDARLIQALLNDHQKYQKVIVYVGTKKHARALYERMSATCKIEVHPVGYCQMPDYAGPIGCGIPSAQKGQNSRGIR